MKRGKCMSIARFTALWMDRSVSVADIAAELAISRAAVGIRAKSRGLPPRRGQFNARPRKIDGDPLFPDMWRAGVGVLDMARHFNVAHTTIQATAQRLGLPRRNLGRWRVIGMEEYRANVLRVAMAASARAEQAAMRAADMVDKVAHHPSGKRAA